MGTLSFSLIRFTQHNDCSEGFEDKQGGNVGPVPSEASVSPPPIAPSGAIPSKTIPTSQLPGKYKKRPFAYTEDSTDEEDVDMEIEDNDSSGSSVDSDHVPAKRLRTSIATRSSRAISVSEKSTDVGALPSDARDDTPGPGNSDTEPEPNCDPEVPDLNSSMNALSPGARLDPARDTTPPRHGCAVSWCPLRPGEGYHRPCNTHIVQLRTGRHGSRRARYYPGRS